MLGSYEVELVLLGTSSLITVLSKSHHHEKFERGFSRHLKLSLNIITQRNAKVTLPFLLNYLLQITLYNKHKYCNLGKTKVIYKIIFSLF